MQIPTHYIHTHRRTHIKKTAHKSWLHALFLPCVLSGGFTEAESHVYECAGFTYCICLVCKMDKLANIWGSRLILQVF